MWAQGHDRDISDPTFVTAGMARKTPQCIEWAKPKIPALLNSTHRDDMVVWNQPGISVSDNATSVANARAFSAQGHVRRNGTTSRSVRRWNVLQVIVAPTVNLQVIDSLVTSLRIELSEVRHAWYFDSKCQSQSSIESQGDTRSVDSKSPRFKFCNVSQASYKCFVRGGWFQMEVIWDIKAVWCIWDFDWCILNGDAWFL